MVDIKNLSFGYLKRQLVLENLSIQLQPGHIYGLLGRNGVGKSSLLHHICGLLFPSTGTISVIDESPAKRSPAFLQHVFLLPEEFNLPNISVKSYLDIFSPFYPSFDSNLFECFLEEFEVSTTNTLQNMSYGQKKKVLISFALAVQSKVLLMDEPTNGLDIPSKKQFRKIIAGALGKDQIIFISTHQVKDLDNLIDEVLILDDKKIILQEPIDRITEKLLFKQVMNPEEINAPLYHEGALKGYAVVGINDTQEHTRFDMELFFNAVLSEKNQILPLFNQ